MYIYKIENLINHKKYIGSTNNWERRKKEHFSSAKLESATSYNYPLQKALRKYGEDNFSFEIIEKCDEDIVSEREKYYIILYNSLTNTGWGYNQTLYTDCALRDEKIIASNIDRTGKRCALVDENNNILQIFKSYHEASRTMLGVNEASSIREVCNGNYREIKGYIFRNLDKNNNVIIPVNKTRKRKTAIYGIKKDNPNDIVYYNSISEAARVENLARGSISKCVNGSTRYSCVGGRIWKKEAMPHE